MKANEILIAPKITKIEWDMKRLNFREKQLKEFYKRSGLNVERIFESHKRQKESLENIKKLLSNSKLIERDDIAKEIVKRYKIIIAFGGDNHFQYVSHFMDNNLMLGINSDPKRSEGALTSVSCENIDLTIKRLLNDDFFVEEWHRLDIEVDGRKIDESAISEVFIGEEKRNYMSRHIIKLKDKVEEQKGSGILICTGAGSTGWYNSASRYLFPNGNSFSKTLNEAKFILTEPYNGRLSKLKMLSGRIKDNEIIEIVSLSDFSAIVSIDSLRLIKLKEGAKIKVKIGKPLKVIKLRK